MRSLFYYCGGRGSKAALFILVLQETDGQILLAPSRPCWRLSHVYGIGLGKASNLLVSNNRESRTVFLLI